MERVTSPTGPLNERFDRVHAALSIPHDADERAALYAEAGLTDEERQAMDQWCFDQQRQRARGVLLNDAEDHR